MSAFLLARFIHVVAGVIWAGALVFISWYLLPSIRGAGPAGGGVMQQLVLVRAAKKQGALTVAIQAGGAPPSAEQGAELGRLQNRLFVAGRLVAVIVLLAVTCMGVARYVP